MLQHWHYFIVQHLFFAISATTDVITYKTTFMVFNNSEILLNSCIHLTYIIVHKCVVILYIYQLYSICA